MQQPVADPWWSNIQLQLVEEVFCGRSRSSPKLHSRSKAWDEHCCWCWWWWWSPSTKLPPPNPISLQPPPPQSTTTNQSVSFYSDLSLQSNLTLLQSKHWELAGSDQRHIDRHRLVKNLSEKTSIITWTPPGDKPQAAGNPTHNNNPSSSSSFLAFFLLQLGSGWSTATLEQSLWELWYLGGRNLVFSTRPPWRLSWNAYCHAYERNSSYLSI